MTRAVVAHAILRLSSITTVHVLMHAAITVAQLRLVGHGLASSSSPAFGQVAVSADGAYYFVPIMGSDPSASGFAANAGISMVSTSDGSEVMQYLPESAGAAYCLVYHDGHIYAGTISRPGRVFKLSTALWGTSESVVGNVTFATGHDLVLGLAVDGANGRAYASINSGHVETIDLASFTVSGSIATNLTSQYFIVLDVASGFGYVGENNNPGVIVRVSLSAAPSNVTTLTLTGHDRAYPLCILGGRLYVAMDITTTNSRLGVVQVDDDGNNFSLVAIGNSSRQFMLDAFCEPAKSRLFWFNYAGTPGAVITFDVSETVPRLIATQTTPYNNFLGPALDPVHAKGIVATNTYLPMATASTSSITSTCASAARLEVVGHTALVICSGQPATLQVWDITNRSNPHLAASTVISDQRADFVGSAVDARGFLFLTDASVMALDVYGPFYPNGPSPTVVPSRLGQFKFTSPPGGVLAGPDRHVWVSAAQGRSVHGLLVESTGAVTHVAEINVGGSTGVLGNNAPFMIVTQGGGSASTLVLVVVTDAPHGEVWNVTAPLAPTLLSSFTPDHADPAEMTSYGGDGYFYLTYGSGWMSEYLISVGELHTPPRHQGTVNLGVNSSCSKLVCSYTNVYSLDSNNGALVEVNAIDPTALVLLGSRRTRSSHPLDVKMSGGDLLVVGDSGLEIVRVVNSSLIEFDV